MTAQELFIVLIRITGLWVMLYGCLYLLGALSYLFYVPPSENDLERGKAKANHRERLAGFYMAPFFLIGGFALMAFAKEIADHFK
jgi:uncharacterized membrane protein